VAGAKQGKNESVDFDAQAIGGSLQRIENLLALLLIKDEEEAESIMILDRVGYSASDIAKLIGKRPNAISVVLYRSRKKQKS
jgi:DNA-directed RNA polymerase specialized sigma24 family protein